MSLKEWFCLHKWKRIDRISKIKHEFKSSDGLYEEKQIEYYYVKQCEKCGWKLEKYDETIRESTQRK